jgi:glycosyltransferase involved in cell wall biosynthesis
MIISILIPSIPERAEYLRRLIIDLNKQKDYVNRVHPTLGDIEIVIDDSVSFLLGGKTVGQKRNDLVQRAKGDYLCFLDDDDEVPPNYVEELLRGASWNFDIVTFKSLFKCDTYWATISMSLSNTNDEATPNGIVKRNAWHICPMRSSIAKKHTFSDKNNAEDWDWMARVLKEIHTEKHLDMFLHQYNHYASVSEVDKIERQ